MVNTTCRNFRHFYLTKITIWIFLQLDENTPIVTKVEVEAADPTADRRSQFYRNPTFWGVLIGVGALIVVVIVCLLLVAFRGGHVSFDKIHGNYACPPILIFY